MKRIQMVISMLMFLVAADGAAQEPISLGFDGKLDGFVAHSRNKYGVEYSGNRKHASSNIC